MGNLSLLGGSGRRPREASGYGRRPAWTQGYGPRRTRSGGLTVWLPILAGGNMPEEAQGNSHQGALVGKHREVCERGHDTLVQLR